MSYVIFLECMQQREGTVLHILHILLDFFFDRASVVTLSASILFQDTVVVVKVNTQRKNRNIDAKQQF
jgi:hypothetical protein